MYGYINQYKFPGVVEVDYGSTICILLLKLVLNNHAKIQRNDSRKMPLRFEFLP